jgi:outer membrane protein assembly factor BamB
MLLRYRVGLAVRRRWKRHLAAVLTIVLAACASRTAATSAAVASRVLTYNESGVTPQWSVSPKNGGRAVAVAGGAVIVQLGRMVDRRVVYGVAAYDVASGDPLWQRNGPQVLQGTPLFLADGPSLERVDIRTGRILWRTGSSCSQDPQHSSYVKVVDESVYVGCNGGDLFRLNLADGRVLASQHPISVDYYEKIESLPNAALAVAGYASIGMYSRSAILSAQTLHSVSGQPFSPDLDVLGTRNGQAIVADVCCRGEPDTNSPGAVWGVSLTTGEPLWSVAIRPYHPPLPLSDVEPGAGVFVLGGNELYVGTRTALFVYRIGDLRAMGSKAPGSKLYSDLRDRPDVYGGRYLGISEGQGATVRRSALFDTVTGRELWSDASSPWIAPQGAPQTPTVVEMYGVTRTDRRFGLLRLSDGKMLPIDTGCYLQAANERYAVALCGRRGRLPELALFDFDSKAPVASAPSEAPVGQTTGSPNASPATIDPILARWTEHQWNLIGKTDETYFFGRDPNGIVAVSRKSGAVVWQNHTVCNVASLARVINGILYVGCPDTIAILDRSGGQVRHKQSIGIYGFNAIVPAGNGAIVVEGWNSGAALRSDMALLDKNTLHHITDRQMTDSTFLGVIGDRAYVDDWCCFGRADQYRPATIYSISLKDGSASEPVDLYPEPDLHPANAQPLGQGERNYLKGDSFYVVTTIYTYQYDVNNLNAPPIRTITPSNSTASP